MTARECQRRRQPVSADILYACETGDFRARLGLNPRAEIVYTCDYDIRNVCRFVIHRST
jgi:hypothetical protein